ncbi:PepSY domain-containing protein [Microbulbifer sp.]|uniref:PepSY domain-containing protein n=1 Tax=Microbulbifer sp. TaxID=1908541 RepID=UPI00258951F3|nr:PepSY domain-containing protein [Microbulbifer sp.]
MKMIGTLSPLAPLAASVFIAVGSLGLLATNANADEKPPAGAMALSMVLTKLEQQGYTPITDVSLERGLWEVDAYKNGEKFDLKVDPNSGEVKSMKRDKD